jgi:hypothetical protein
LEKAKLEKQVSDWKVKAGIQTAFKFSSSYKLEDISAESVTIGTNEPVTGKSGTTLTKTTGWYIAESCPT